MMNLMRLKSRSPVQLMSMASTLWQLNLLEMAIKNGGDDIEDLAKKINLQLWHAAVRSKLFPKEMLDFPLVESYMDSYGLAMDKSFPNALELVRFIVVKPLFSQPVLLDIAEGKEYRIDGLDNSSMGSPYLRFDMDDESCPMLNFTGWSIKDAVICTDGPEEVLMRPVVPGPVPLGNTYSHPGKVLRSDLVVA